MDGDGYFRLNGKRIYLHSSHTGNCMPESTHHISRNPELLRHDFLLAKAAGFNTLRFISGAALPPQLDLCGEIGLMVYEEPVSSWLELNGLHATELYLHDLLTMVRRDRSHPSVTIWGLLNETYSTPPFDNVCNAARDALPELRKLDDSRLVLFSSGRWDSYIDVGSLANHGSDKWQNLWGSDGDASASGDRGDIHYYPDSVPLRAPAQKRMRSFGSSSGRPVFVSESGVGSVLDTVSLVRRFAQDGAVKFCPDVKMIGRINGIFPLGADAQEHGKPRVLPHSGIRPAPRKSQPLRHKHNRTSRSRHLRRRALDTAPQLQAHDCRCAPGRLFAPALVRVPVRSRSLSGPASDC
ncbi:MAG: glycoside hydrolase family 2 TIM barrel-domain containing protein [Eubacteriales bacterium]